jgi:hypothetical protein
MSAELELAVWTTDAMKLWSTFVEPPWSYRVPAGQIELDAMGQSRTSGEDRSSDKLIGSDTRTCEASRHRHADQRTTRGIDSTPNGAAVV